MRGAVRCCGPHWTASPQTATRAPPWPGSRRTQGWRSTPSTPRSAASPRSLLAVHDLVLGEGATDQHGEPAPALQRRYVKETRAATTAEDKIATYAAALGRLLPRTAPLLDALRDAGVSDPECRRVWESLEERRARNMRLFAADLRATGRLRDGITDEVAADLVWSMNSASYFLALSRRGWTGEQYADLVREVWARTLLDS